MENTNRGFTLIEVMLATSILGVVALLSYQDNVSKYEISQSKDVGKYLGAYSDAVRSWLAENDIGSLPQPVIGTTWLKPSSCGGIYSKSYLPCEFPDMTDAIRLKDSNIMVSTIISNSIMGGRDTSKATISTSSYMKDGKLRSDLAGIAAITVASLNITGGKNGSESSRSNPHDGSIIIQVGNESSAEPWLRVDGANQLSGGLKFTSSNETKREIYGASSISSLAGELLFLGNSDGSISSSISSGVVVDSDSKIIGTLVAASNFYSGSDLKLNSGNLEAKAGKSVGKKLVSSESSSRVIDPSEQSTINTLNTRQNLAVDGYVHIASRVIDKSSCVGSEKVISIDTGDRVSTCKDGIWTRVSKSPRIERYSFYEDTLGWKVPKGTIAAFVSMAGGGGTGLGWRSYDYIKSGHSGGFIMNHPLNISPNEELNIIVGQGAIGFLPKNSSTLASPGHPYYVATNPSVAGNDGVSGNSGTSSKIHSVTKDITLIECTGGSGAAMKGHSGLSTMYAPTQTLGSPILMYTKNPLSAPNNTPSHIASGAYALHDEPGACGPSNYGRGTSGLEAYVSASGDYAGGTTPFGFGSGGSVYKYGCYVTFSNTGQCSSIYNGRNGVVYIDILL